MQQRTNLPQNQPQQPSSQFSNRNSNISGGGNAGVGGGGSLPQNEEKFDFKQMLNQVYQKPNQCKFDEELYEIAPELQTLQKLIEYEKQIDQIIKQKRSDLQEYYAKPVPQFKNVLRIYISHQYQNADQEDQQWILSLSGKLLVNEEEIPLYDRQQFSSFFNQIDIIPDKLVYDEQINWKRNNQDTDGLKIGRYGNTNSSFRIYLHPYNNPPQYKVHQDLQRVIGYSLTTRTNVLASIWEYIKLQGLQDNQDKHKINCDENLKRVFKADKISMGQITNNIRHFLMPPDPIVINYYMDLDKDENQNLIMYDMDVDVDTPFGIEIMPFLAQRVVWDDKKDSPAHPYIVLNQKIKKIEQQVGEIVDKVQNHNFKRDSYAAYTLNPSLFIENLIMQQNMLLAIMREQDNKDQEDPSKIDYLIENQEILEKQIKKYLDSIQN